MGTSKLENYTEEQLLLAKYAKALSHPARVAILQLLLERKTCICGDIVDDLPLSQSTVSQHLKELKSSGLIRGAIDGTAVCYCIDEMEWSKAKDMLEGLFDAFVIPENKCC